MTTYVVIPSWGRTSREIESETGARYPAFITLGGRPLYHRILEKLDVRPLTHDVQLIVAADAPDIDAVEVAGASVGLQQVRLAESRSIGDSVLAALQRPEFKDGDRLFVNMADTLVDLDTGAAPDVVFTQVRNDLYKWTSVERRPDGALLFPCDRADVEPEMFPREIFVGVFVLSKIIVFRDLLQAAVSEPADGIDPLFTALERYSAQVRVALVDAPSWLDFGHIDSYYESKLAHQNLRHFNSLEYDRIRGLVTKRSQRVEQFRHQVRWFRQLPDELTAFVPRLHRSDDGEAPFVTMDMLSSPTLSELFLAQRMPVGAWNGVARTLAEILGRFAKYSVSSTLAPLLARSVYLDKTQERLKAFIADRPETRHMWVNGTGGRLDLDAVMARLPEFVERNGLLDCHELTPIHGDFCFSNILFDAKSSSAKMIDPRGEFGVPGIFGDRRYDLAKLSHSFSGGYDFVVADRFSVEVGGDGRLALSTPQSLYRSQVEKIFVTWLQSDAAMTRQIKAIEALLFLSMLPLHSDTPRRQLAMLANGLRLFAALSSEIVS